jgi:hypothetical protein
MALLPVSHVTEHPGEIRFPWVIRCQKCGKEVARIDQEELAAMVAVETVEPVYCFDCEPKALVDKDHNIIIPRPADKGCGLWPTIRVPASLLPMLLDNPGLV